MDTLLTEGQKNNELRFFQIDGNISTSILRINKSLKEQNEKSPFISKFIKLAGYPKWDKAFFLPKKDEYHTVPIQIKIFNLQVKV